MDENPFYRNALILGTLGAFVVNAYDQQGKTGLPPANVVGQLLSVTASSTVAALIVVNTISGPIYDTALGRSGNPTVTNPSS